MEAETYRMVGVICGRVTGFEIENGVTRHLSASDLTGDEVERLFNRTYGPFDCFERLGPKPEPRLSISGPRAGGERRAFSHRQRSFVAAIVMTAIAVIIQASTKPMKAKVPSGGL